MKKRLFRLVVVVAFVVAFASAGFMALPDEIKAEIPQITELTALISGLSFGGIGSLLLYAKDLGTKQGTEANIQILELGSEFLKLDKKYDRLDENLNKSLNTLGVKYDIVLSGINALKIAVERNNELLKADMKLKLDNDLIDEKVRQEVSEVLNNEEMDL